MAGDLEDFLRRAAQRRQQKAAQQKQQAPAPRREPPEYSDSRRERITTPREPDEPILVADIVDSTSGNYVAQLLKLEETERLSAEAKKTAKKQAALATAKAKRSAEKLRLAAGATATGNPAIDIVNMLKRPGGVQQAILLREIFDRPEHRW